MVTQPESDPHPGTFIVGTGRCGSTLLSRIINQHNDILSLSEFFIALGSQAFAYKRLSGPDFWRMLSVAMPSTRLVFRPDYLPDEFIYPLKPDSAFTQETVPPVLFSTLPLLTEDHDALYFELEPIIKARPKADLAEHYLFLFHWLQDRFDKAMWIERTGSSLSFLPSLYQHFPDARFVHLIRDGRDVALSIQKHPGMKLFALLWRDLRKIGIDLLRPPFMLASNRPSALFERWFGEWMPLQSRLDQDIPVEWAGEFWSETVKAGLETWTQLPAAQRHEMRYEDLMADPEQTLRGFADFTGFDADQGNWVQTARDMIKPQPSRWLDLPTYERAMLEAACKPGLELLGY